MNTLITGGEGLLASSIEFGLKPSKKQLNILNYNDLCHYIEANKIDSIIHTAARVGGVKANTDFVFDFFSENMLMSLNIMNACKKYSIKKTIFIVSTCAFPVNTELPLKEENLHNGEPHNTNFGYAYAKRMLEVGSRALKNQYKISSYCLIPCNLYGENDNYNFESGHVIPSLIHKCYLAKLNNTKLEVWGSGKAEREFIYVKDFASIIGKIYKEDIDINETMIVSPNHTHTIQEIVEVIAKKINFTGNIFFDKTKPEGIMKKNSCNDKFKKYFPNFKFTSLDEGLDNTIEYFIKNYDKLRK
jgi:GDP-L-fucose synthase